MVKVTKAVQCENWLFSKSFGQTPTSFLQSGDREIPIGSLFLALRVVEVGLVDLLFFPTLGNLTCSLISFSSSTPPDLLGESP